MIDPASLKDNQNQEIRAAYYLGKVSIEDAIATCQYLLATSYHEREFDIGAVLDLDQEPKESEKRKLQILLEELLKERTKDGGRPMVLSPDEKKERLRRLPEMENITCEELRTMLLAHQISRFHAVASCKYLLGTRYTEVDIEHGEQRGLDLEEEKWERLKFGELLDELIDSAERQDAPSAAKPIPQPSERAYELKRILWLGNKTDLGRVYVALQGLLQCTAAEWERHFIGDKGKDMAGSYDNVHKSRDESYSQNGQVNSLIKLAEGMKPE